MTSLMTQLLFRDEVAGQNNVQERTAPTPQTKTSMMNCSQVSGCLREAEACCVPAQWDRGRSKASF